MACPGGYQEGTGGACVLTCPPDFKYVQEGGTQKCVYITDNTKSVIINAFVKPSDANTIPETYARESARVALELLNIRNELAVEENTRTSLENARVQGENWNSQYGKIQSESASYGEDIEKLNSVTESLKPRRPPTAPQDDLEKERRAVSAALQKNYLLLQISAFIAFVVLFVYVVLPVEYAHPTAFLLLVSGIVIGIFLRK